MTYSMSDIECELLYMFKMSNSDAFDKAGLKIFIWLM
jgi:hypothetical protein